MIRGCCCTRRSPPPRNGSPPRTRPPRRRCSGTLVGRPGKPPPLHGTPRVLVHDTPPVLVHGMSLALVPLALEHDRLVLHGLDCGELARGGLDCGGQVGGGLDCDAQVHGGLGCGGQVQNEPSFYAVQRDGQGDGVPSRGGLCHRGTRVHGVPNPLYDVPHHGAPLQDGPPHDDLDLPHGQGHDAQVHGVQVHGVHGLFQDGPQGVQQYALHDAQAHGGSLELDALHGASHAHAQRV